MGGGEWIEQRQEQQILQLQKAYTQKEAPYVESSSEIEKAFKATAVKVDGIDMAYIWARTFIPSWMMGMFLIAGVIVVTPKLLKRFGIEFEFSLKKKTDNP